MSTPTSTKWARDEYAAADIIFSGSEKLASSAVAPLVAQARGCFTVTDAVGAKKVADLIYTTKGRKPLQDRLIMMTNNGGDFLTIPWHTAGDVIREGIDAVSQSTQVRPRTPLETRDGSKPKYETLAGHPSVIDLHPATPSGWLSTASRVLITEGVLKGDAVLSAQLLAAGVDPAKLAAIEGASTKEARTQLAALLEKVPAVDRVPVLSLIGVGNWHSNPEWNTLNLKDKQVLVAFDGDLRSNKMVWRQASRMFEFLSETKKATPKLLDLGGLGAQQFALNAEVDTSMKLGIDDFLAQVGTWNDALKLIDDTLPAEPAGDSENAEYRNGDWRIADDDVSADKFVRTGTGFEAQAYWERGAVRLGGHVKSVSTLRTASDPDIEDGTAHPGTVTKSGDGEVTIEIRWVDEDGKTRSGLVKGPTILLSLPPSEWAKREGVELDTFLAAHPEWPPRGVKGDGWFSAVKANGAADIVYSEGWDTMGFVPTQSGHPVYVVGDTVIGATVEDERTNHRGVTEESLAKASFFGVKDIWRGADGAHDRAAYKRAIKKDVLEVLDAFTDGNAWRNPVVGPLLLASALRPTAPTSNGIQVFLSGGPGSGKSWSASFMMGFWQARPGAWNETHLPGSANDTVAAIEYARARTPIWVIDDLAPGTSRQEAERQEAAIDASIRAGYNGSGKRRSSAEGKQQRVSVPRALTVYTAENQRENLSIRQRSVDIRFEKGDILNDGALRIAGLTKRADNPMSRVTAAMIRLWTNVDLNDTQLPLMRAIDTDDLDLSEWAGKHQLARRSLARITSDIQDLLRDTYMLSESESSRRSRVFAQLLFTLDVIYALGIWAGISPRDPILARLGGDPDDEESIHGALVKYAAADLAEFRTKSNSRNLIEALRNILQLGIAHLQNPVAAGDRPIPADHPNSDALNQALGWQLDPRSDVWVPRGSPIGFAGFPEGSEKHQWVALLNSQTAFALAQRQFPNLVPNGQKASSSWTQVWTDENGALIDERYTRPVGRELTAKVRLGKDSRLRGIPVKLAALLDDGHADLDANYDGADSI